MCELQTDLESIVGLMTAYTYYKSWLLLIVKHLLILVQVVQQKSAFWWEDKDICNVTASSNSTYTGQGKKFSSLVQEDSGICAMQAQAWQELMGNPLEESNRTHRFDQSDDSSGNVLGNIKMTQYLHLLEYWLLLWQSAVVRAWRWCGVPLLAAGSSKYSNQSIQK